MPIVYKCKAELTIWGKKYQLNIWDFFLNCFESSGKKKDY